MKRILIIDDEAEMLNSLKKILSRRKDFQLTILQDAKEALKQIKSQSFDLIITDLKMKDISGMDILKSALEMDDAQKVILISGYGTIDTSVEAMRSGASDFLEKPFTAQKLFDSIDSVLSIDEQGNKDPDRSDFSEQVFEGIVYKSEEIAKVVQLIKRVAVGETSILITGESGTGKELVARAIHNLSPRKLNPFVPVNCGALPENLFESELFGHERGAFTGAVRTKPGLLEFADSGTFFFDEIGDLGLSLQVKLLRMLEERKIRRVGNVKEIPIDVRIVAATNKSLEKLVEQNLFREDLYYRLTAMTIDIPPLRERPEDILPIAIHILNTVCKDNSGDKCILSKEAIEQLSVYSWPGNVRELQNVIQHAYLLRSGALIKAEDLPISIKTNKSCISDKYLNLPYKDAKNMMLQEFETAYLKHNLQKYGGNISKTARYCEMDRRTIHRWLNKENIIF